MHQVSLFHDISVLQGKSMVSCLKSYKNEAEYDGLV